MKISKLVVTLAVSALLVTGCGVKDSNAIIKINGVAISQSKFDKAMDKSISQSPFGSMVDKNKKDSFFYLATEQKILNEMIIEELLNQEIKTRGIKVTSKDINEETKKIVEQVGGIDRFKAILKENGISKSQFESDLKQQVKMRKLADALGDNTVSDKDCENFYKKNLNKFQHPEMVRASHILLAVNPTAIEQEMKSQSKDGKVDQSELKARISKLDAEQKELAAKLSKELQADNSKFAQYAKKYSQDPSSAEKGGDLGFFPKQAMVPEFATVAFTNKPNTVSNPVKTDFGYHIILVQDRKAAGTDSFEKVKSQIADYLKNEKQIKKLDELTEAAKKKANIEYVKEEYNLDNIKKELDKQMESIKKGHPSSEK